MEKSGNGFGEYEAEKRKSGVDERKSGRKRGRVAWKEEERSGNGKERRGKEEEWIG